MGFSIKYMILAQAHSSSFYLKNIVTTNREQFATLKAYKDILNLNFNDLPVILFAEYKMVILYC